MSEFIKIHDPIFRQNFLISYDCSFKDFFKQVLNEEYEGNPDVIKGYCINTDTSEICIWLADIDDIPTAVHELQHAMQFALYNRCNVDYREQEVPAFYMEFLTNSFLTESKKIKESKSKNEQ